MRREDIWFTLACVLTLLAGTMPWLVLIWLG